MDNFGGLEEMKHVRIYIAYFYSYIKLSAILLFSEKNILTTIECSPLFNSLLWTVVQQPKNISRGSVCRIAKEKLLRRSIPKTSFKSGPKCKLSERQQRLLIRAIKILRNREGNFTCKRLMYEALIEQDQVSERTVSLSQCTWLL